MGDRVPCSPPAPPREINVKAIAILLDTRPGYLDRAHGPASLLLAPLGPATVLRYLGERLAWAGHPRLTIVTDFEPGPDYERRVGDCGVRVDAIVPAFTELFDHLPVELRLLHMRGS